jgi:hypothetical protein
VQHVSLHFCELSEDKHMFIAASLLCLRLDNLMGLFDHTSVDQSLTLIESLVI